MNAYDAAQRFYHACESGSGWDGCREFVADDAVFQAQAEPLEEIRTVREYADWLADFGKSIAPGAQYHLHHHSFDAETSTAIFFATYQARHTGDGGPVPPTGKETNSHYVYVLQMNSESKVQTMTKVWNATWSSREIGWL